jgi:hypothetical protein
MILGGVPDPNNLANSAEEFDSGEEKGVDPVYRAGNAMVQVVA